jgi:hypothetical protein
MAGARTAVMWLVATISVIVLAFLYGRQRGHTMVARAETPSSADWVLADDHGFAELVLPATWGRFHPDKAGNPQAKQTTGARYVQIVSESKGDFAEDVTLDGHSEMTRRLLGKNLTLLDMHGPMYRFVGGFAAVQYECDAVRNSIRLKVLHTSVNGDRAFHQIVCRSPWSQYDRTAFEHLLDGFRERPGPVPEPAPSPKHDMPIVVSETRSAYKVH